MERCRRIFLKNPLKMPRLEGAGALLYRVVSPERADYCASLIAACAAARRAMGTRKGLQET